MSTKVTEIMATEYEDPQREPDGVIVALVAMGWEVEEETPESCTLRHDLIPGARRIVHL